MGLEISKLLQTLSINFMSTQPPTKQELIEFYYNQELVFKGTEQARYDYFDELIDKSDKIKEVLALKNINWPSSQEMMVESRFFSKLTDEQADSLLDAFDLKQQAQQ